MNTELREKMKKAASKRACYCACPKYNWTKCKTKGEGSCDFAIGYSRKDTTVMFYDGAESMYAELVPLVEWVSVKERLPKENETVLVKEIGYLGKPFVNIVYGWEEDRLGRGIDITHWRKIDL